MRTLAPPPVFGPRYRCFWDYFSPCSASLSPARMNSCCMSVNSNPIQSFYRDTSQHVHTRPQTEANWVLCPLCHPEDSRRSIIVVVGWVTTSKSRLLYCLFFLDFFPPLLEKEEGREERKETVERGRFQLAVDVGRCNSYYLGSVGIECHLKKSAKFRYRCLIKKQMVEC